MNFIIHNTLIQIKISTKSQNTFIIQSKSIQHELTPEHTYDTNYCKFSRIFPQTRDFSTKNEP